MPFTFNTDSKHFRFRRKKVIYIFFFSRKKIREILYQTDDFIPIKAESNLSLGYYFYIDLLITIENQSIINYSYTIDLIRVIDNQNKKAKNKIVNVMFSKICIDLITNFEFLETYKKEYKEEVERIEKENKKIISENLKIFEDYFGLQIDEEYFEEDIDKIYGDLIHSLLRNKNFKNYELVLDLMKQLDMENILITKIMYDKLNDILNNEEFVKDYKILDKNDFFNENKINCYCILIKYIFKNSFYFYNINFFLETRRLLIDLLNSNEVINKGKNISFNDKITYVMEKLADSEYYFLRLEKLETVLKYYKEFLFESKKKEIALIEDILDNNKSFEDEILKDYNVAKKMIKELPVIKFILKEKNKLNKKTEKEIKKAVDSWNTLEKMISQQKIKKMKDDERQIICKYFKDDKNKNILIDIFGQNVYDNFLIKIDEFFKQKNAIEQENKKEEKKKTNSKEKKLEEFKTKKDIIYPPENINININNIILINKPSKKESFDSIKDDYLLLNKKSFEEISTKSESKTNIDFQAPEPRIRINRERMKISNIEKSILLKCHIHLHTNKKGFEPFIIYDEKIIYGKHELAIDYQKLMQYKEDFYSYEVNDPRHQKIKKFFEYLDEIEKRIILEFKNEYLLKINLDLIGKRENNSKNTDMIDDITAYYTFFEPVKNRCFQFKEENVLTNKTNSNSQGFQFMLYNINSECYKNIKYSEEFLKKNEIILFNSPSGKTNFFEKSESPYERKAHEYTVIEFIKTLGIALYSADFIQELSNGYYIIGSQNTLIVYDHQFLEKPYLTTKCKDWVYSICERISINKKNNENKNLQIICCMNGSIGLLELTEKKSILTTIEAQQKQNNKKKSKKDKTKNTYNTCIEMREDNYIMAGLRGVVYYHNFFMNQTEIEQIKVTEKSFRVGIKLNENIVALTSNSVIPEGNDELIFYNVKKGNLVEGAKGYSFLMSENGMALIKKKDGENKVLLCACKKYIKDQKNGILLVNPQLGENKEIKNPFYDTGDYEVYCICPIFNVVNNNKDYDVEKVDEDYKKNIEITGTDFFLVGCYEPQKRQSCIKLYKIIFSEKVVDTKIKFLQNIEICNKQKEKLDGFEVQIKSMIQSKITGNILITCANGNIYLFTKPNLEHYIKRQK